MRITILVVFIGSFLLLWGLAGCAQTTQLTAAAPATSAPASVAPSATAPTIPHPPIPTLAPASATPASSPTPLPPAASPTPAATAVPTKVNLTPLPPVVSGKVQDAGGPLGGVIVQIQGSPNKTTTARDGSFELRGITGTTPITLVAAAAGYMNGWTTLNPSADDYKGPTGITITLKPVPEKDNNNYPWFVFNGVGGSASCAPCHREYKEWQADAHSQSAKNQRFLTVYLGTNVKGEQSQAVRYGDQGAALPADPNLPDYGPGYRLDNPTRAGNCATCHTPVASKQPNQKNCGWSGCHTELTIERSPRYIDPATLAVTSSEIGLDGVSCDFCHKVGDVILDPATNLPLPDMPGILSMRLFRPEEGQQVFFGTVVDVTRRVSYSPLETQSEYCAPCHYGVFGGIVGVGKVTGGVVIYNSYGEWLESPYSDPKTGKTCQDCHMPVSPSKYFVFPEAGGLSRDYVQLHNHTMPGATDQKLLQNSVTMKASAQRSGDQLQVEVSITNDQTGHHIPTDAPIRSMILVVEARDAGGKLLALRQGPVNPQYSGNYARLPGKTYAKVLRDDWTGETPTTAYWRPVTVVEDTRLAALATDTTRYTFDLPAGQTANVSVKLVFRRAFQQLAQQKGWNDPDILMEEATIQVTK